MVLDECRDEIAVAIGQICLVLANVLIFLLIDKIQSVYRERLDINLLKQQNQVYENQILLLTESEQRISALQHDLKNHLFSLEQLAEQSNSDSLKKYLQSLIKDVGGMHSFSETGNLVIDGFINSKLSKAKILGADIHIEISIPTNIEIEDKDISIILGNLLDNAVSAVGKCKEDKKISVIMRATPGKLYLKIENSHAEQIRKNGNKIISSKGDSEHHGIGLRNVQKVVEKYDGNMKVTYSENMFSVKVIMFIP